MSTTHRGFSTKALPDKAQDNAGSGVWLDLTPWPSSGLSWCLKALKRTATASAKSLVAQIVEG